jgi:hypothetical protein
MKSKTFIILLVICAALAGASWFLLQPGSSPGREKNDKTGERLLAGLPVNDILRIDIAGHGSGVVLEKGETVWVVKDKFGYPADFPKLSGFVLKLRDMKIDRTFPASEDILNRLSLRAPGAASENRDADAGGTRVTLKGADGMPLSDIIIGKARESDAGRGGNFVMPAGESTVYVVDKDFNFLDTDAGRWIDKQLVDIPSEKIARVDRIDPDAKAPLYSVRRPEKDKPAELLDVPEGKTVTPAKVNRLMDALAAFRVDDVIDPETPMEKTGLDAGPCFRYALFDGTVYTLCLGKTVDGNPDQTYLKTSVGFHPPPSSGDEVATPGKATPGETPPTEGDKTEAAPDTPPEKTPEKTKEPADPALAASEQHQKISPWIFAVPQWKADQLITDKADFFETPEAE